MRGLSVAFVLWMSMTLAASSALADPVVTAAGDIASAGRPNRPQMNTAALIRRIDPTAVLTLGDNQYPDGSLRHFRRSYDPTWGEFRSKTYPTAGNHEYETPNAGGYFRYFGWRAHRRHGGYYSYDLGFWHVIAANSGVGSVSATQLSWIKSDLRRDQARCELVYWHHPLWSSGVEHGGETSMRPLWTVLFQAGVDVVLNGHEHLYERFAPMRPSGRYAPQDGVRQFTVGTGGAAIDKFGRPIRNSQRRIPRHGVIRLDLSPGLYRWAFIRGDGNVVDSGEDRCHS
jgi:acid phosphatase type 7